MDIKPPSKRRIPQAPSIPGNKQGKIKEPMQGPPESISSLDNPQGIKKRKPIKWAVISLLLVVATVLIGCYMIYQQALLPVDSSSKQKMRVIISQGENSASIGDMLEKRQIIKSSLAFRVHSQLTGAKHQLQAGVYAFSQADSAVSIIDSLRSGKTDIFNITILPGQSLKDIKKSLKKQGFTSREIAKAFSREYKNPVLGDRIMAASSLEGYLFPETYQLDSNGSLESLIERSMDELNSQINQSSIVKRLQKQKLSLPQAITLASIIQKEVVSEQDERQVAQIFLKRLREGMKLDADSTFVYAAKQQHKTPTVEFDSDYNTRLHTGLPPGPIGNFNFSALKAVANPASGKYLYFVSGDDGTTYFAQTLQEHEQNVRRYCKANCNIF